MPHRVLLTTTEDNKITETMEEESATTDDAPWTSATNWTIADGSLENSIVFESSVSPIDEIPSKIPLILYPSSPDSPTPCEIKICFPQKHEVRQVYVRSTARVYELYYTPAVQGTNEYLCTVRCCLAEKDDEVIHTTGEEEAPSADVKVSSEDPTEEKLKRFSNMSPSEDDWVDVKVPDNSQLDNSLASKFHTNPQNNTQDFYEATAQISDADPCTSLTLRLLSLQSKGCVCVDEIYVFADPVDSDDSDQVDQVENSMGSSLMAMLVPTILQMSKTRDISPIQDKHTSDARENRTFHEIGSKATNLTNTATEIQQDGKPILADQLEEANEATVGPGQLKSPPGFPITENKSEVCPHNHVETTLDQLLSRMSRIEDICLRFEENLLKPISSIETRLQRVEQQLEVLTKNQANFGFPYCTRIRAPEFSYTESDSNFYDDGRENLNCGSLESYEKNIPLETSILPGDMFDSGNDTQLHPSIVITAPDFSCGSELESDKKDFPIGVSITSGDMPNSENRTRWLLPSLVMSAPEFSNEDNEEDNHAAEPNTESLKENPKQAFSIDDVLASALAGLLSSTSIQPPVTAPEFSNENTTMDLLPRHFVGTDGADCTNDSLPDSSHLSSKNEENVTISFDNAQSEKDGSQVDEDDVYSQGSYIDSTVSPIKQDIARTDLYQNDMFYIPNKLLEDQTDGSSATYDEGDIVLYNSTSATEVAEEGSNIDILNEVLEYSHVSSTLDFDIPILDVKFTSQEDSSTRSFLETLLADTSDSCIQVPCLNKSNNDSLNEEQLDLILVENEESIGPASHSHFSVDMDYYNVNDVPPSIEGEKHHICGNQEMFSASLI